MSSLEISLLGAPRIELEGEPVALDTRKAVALLAFLAVTGRPHTRDALCALLWPDYDQEHARGALRRTLSALRKALGSERLDAGRERVALVRDDGVRIDVDAFRGALAAGDSESLARAVELYAGDFLAGFSLRDSVNFDDWQYFESESLRRELAGALERLASEHAARRDYDRAILLTRRWLSLNPLHEPVHRRLMELYALKGERGAALRQYRECVRLLDTELGVAPVEATTALQRAIQEERLEVRGASTSPEPPPAATPEADAWDRPALVGRAGDSATLRTTYEGISTDGRLVVVEGEPGIGKTALAAELVRHVAGLGGSVIAVRCYEEERELAFAPVAQALREAVAMTSGSSEALAEAARLLPQLGAPPDRPLDTPGAQTRFFESIASLIHDALAGSPPGVLLVDDAQWADSASVEFLGFLVRRLSAQPLLVLLTWRHADVPPAHPLRRLLETARESGAALVTLRRLSRDEVRALVRSLAPDAPEGSGARIYEESEGVPLLVVEYCRALERGEAAAGEGVRGLLRARLLPLTDVAAQALAAAAVIGRSFDPDVLREVSGRTDEEIVAALEELTARGLIEESGDAYDFRHERLRAAMAEELSLARRRLLHRRTADALARRAGASGPLAGSVSRHYQLGGREAEAARFARLAGEHARRLFANVDALAHFEAALALGDPDPASLHRAIGDLKTLIGDYDGAIRSYEASAALAPAAQVAEVEHKLGAIHLRRGAWDVAATYLESALTSANGEPAQAARLAADLSLARHRAGESSRARELARTALGLAVEGGDDAAQAQAHNILGLLAASEGDAESARPHLEQSLALTATAEDPDARVAALNNLALVLRSEGAFGRALELTEEALLLCSTRGDRHREAALHNNLADLLRAAGRSGEAMEHLKQAVSLFADVGTDAGTEPEIWKLVSW